MPEPPQATRATARATAGNAASVGQLGLPGPVRRHRRRRYCGGGGGAAAVAAQRDPPTSGGIGFCLSGSQAGPFTAVF